MGFRLEEKIKLHFSDYIKLKNKIFELGGKNIYKQRKISSVYFDNKNFDMFNDSEEGCVPRKKIRLRRYPENDDGKYYFETKITSSEGKFKKSNFYNKDNFLKYLEDGIVDNSYGLIEKKIIISYSREYFVLENTRLTLDYNINYSNINETNNFFDNESLILEIKANNNVVAVQEKLKNILPLRRERFSKYCEGINKLFNKSSSQRLFYSI